jgi:5S rRNA maturation endonuclease (ribonuclease M5)
MGRIIDSETGDPVAAANIFFANSQAGTFSDDSGYFKLEIPEYLPLQLVISHVSYDNKFMPIDSFPVNELLVVKLKSKVEELEEVRILTDLDREWNRFVKKFTHAFLGETDNSQKCDIVNPHVIEFVGEKDMLKAYSDYLIIVENMATGYRVHFLLEYFSMQGDQVSFSGKPYFESLTAQSDKEISRWEKNRKYTYYGSLRHFLHTLVRGTTYSDGFEIVSGQMNHKNEFTFKGLISPADIIIREKGKIYINLKNTIKVVYTKERDLTRSLSGMENFKIDNDYQTSYLNSRIARIQVNQNGILFRPDLIQVYGFWSREGAADFLPFDYSPLNGE